MAKMFYTLEETQSALGRSADEIAQLTREGRLREFRDGKKTMYRADQVDALKGTLGSGAIEPVDMGPSDSGSPIGLADTGGSGGSGLGLSLADTGGGSGLAGLGGGAIGSGFAGSGMGSAISSGLGSGISSAGSGIMNLKEDTSLSADLGLSGTAGGMPSPARGNLGGSMGGLGGGIGSGLENLPGSGAGTGSGGSLAGGSLSGGSMSGTRSGMGTGGGINVLGDDDASFDPMAQTAISSAPMTDLNLESVGSGSGLLDLTRESDDTSLGAEVLDEITPSGRGRAASPSGSSVSKVTLEAPSGGVVRGGGPVVNYVEANDPVGTALGWMTAGAGIVLLFGIFALTSSVFNVGSPALDWMQEKGFLVIVGVLLIPPVVLFIVGFLAGGRSTTR